MDATSETEVYGLIGYPVKHSISPQIHNSAFKTLKINAVYLTFEVKKEFLKKALDGVKALGVKGVNVTIPYKIDVVKHLDELSQEATLIGAVNTILNTNGKLIGFNTDGIGVLKAFKAYKVELTGKKVVLLGAGGAAKAIGYAIADKVNSLIILNRTKRKALMLSKELKRKLKANALGGDLTLESLRKSLINADIIVNATSIGMTPNFNQTPVPKELLKSNMVVLDVVYNPLETKLLQEAKEAGAKCINGVEMLVQQAAEAFKIWFKVDPPIDEMRKAALKSLIGKEVN
ncbi:shikimate dehydrogenase [Candidatus Bathyarchaeota archaeon]|nr:shikimate dehydrogenase [Candidatus Bathyarchaeota archaeon]